MTHDQHEHNPTPAIDPFDAFQTLDMRVGRITRVEVNDKARKPAYKLWLDFGPELGEKQSSAQFVDLYSPDDLTDRLVIAAVKPRRAAHRGLQEPGARPRPAG